MNELEEKLIEEIKQEYETKFQSLLNTLDPLDEFTPYSPTQSLILNCYNNFNPSIWIKMLSFASAIRANERERILKLLDTDEFKIEDGMHYEKGVDITEMPAGLIAEMNGLRKGWEAVIKLIKEKINGE